MVDEHYREPSSTSGRLSMDDEWYMFAEAVAHGSVTST